MPKEYFDFKQFRVYQDQCAMKVGSDSCLFGALIEVQNHKRVLDIGTGTGLLALMIAQRACENTKIVAIEIDEKAAIQAVENAKNSVWNTQIMVLNQSIQSFCLAENEGKFDLIVSNPPFYQNNLQSPYLQTNMARHAVSLSFKELVASVDYLLSQDGAFYVMLPTKECETFLNLTTIYFECIEIISIKINPMSAVSRKVAKLIRKGKILIDKCKESEVCMYEKIINIVKNSVHSYTIIIQYYKN